MTFPSDGPQVLGSTEPQPANGMAAHSLAAAQIAIVRGHETTLAQILRATPGALADLAEEMIFMLRGDGLSGKWILAIEPCRGRGRPRHIAPDSLFASAAQEHKTLLETLQHDPTTAARHFADLLDPPVGSRWKLVFRARRPGNPVTDLHQELVAAWINERIQALQKSGFKKREAAIAELSRTEGIPRRSIFRYLRIAKSSHSPADLDRPK